MQILLISKFYPPAQSARALQMHKVVAALRKAGCGVHVVAGLEGGKRPEPEGEEDVSYVRYDKNVHLQRFHNLWGMAGWMLRAAIRAIRICRTLKPDIVFTASTPVDSHIAGLLMRSFVRLPWMAYFSDPWPPSICPAPYNRDYGAWRAMLQKWMVGRIVRNADGLVVTNKYARELMRTVYSMRSEKPTFVIPHIGSRPEGVPGARTNTVAHIGDLLNRVSPALLDAIKQLASGGAAAPGRIIFAGTASRELEDFIRNEKLEGFVECRGWLPPDQALDIMWTSGLLLIIEAEMAYSPFLPSKFADYAQTGIPLLAITPNRSAIRDGLERYGGGRAVPHDAGAIAGAVRDLLAHPSDACVRTTATGLAGCFHGEAVAAQYTQAMQSVLTSEKQPARMSGKRNIIKDRIKI